MVSALSRGIACIKSTTTPNKTGRVDDQSYATMTIKSGFQCTIAKVFMLRPERSDNTVSLEHTVNLLDTLAVELCLEIIIRTVFL